MQLPLCPCSCCSVHAAVALSVQLWLIMTRIGASSNVEFLKYQGAGPLSANMGRPQAFAPEREHFVQQNYFFDTKDARIGAARRSLRVRFFDDKKAVLTIKVGVSVQAWTKLSPWGGFLNFSR